MGVVVVVMVAHMVPHSSTGRHMCGEMAAHVVLLRWLVVMVMVGHGLLRMDVVAVLCVVADLDVVGWRRAVHGSVVVLRQRRRHTRLISAWRCESAVAKRWSGWSHTGTPRDSHGPQHGVVACLRLRYRRDRRGR